MQDIFNLNTLTADSLTWEAATDGSYHRANVRYDAQPYELTYELYDNKAYQLTIYDSEVGKYIFDEIAKQEGTDEAAVERAKYELIKAFIDAMEQASSSDAEPSISGKLDNLKSIFGDIASGYGIEEATANEVYDAIDDIAKTTMSRS